MGRPNPHAGICYELLEAPEEPQGEAVTHGEGPLDPLRGWQTAERAWRPTESLPDLHGTRRVNEDPRDTFRISGEEMSGARFGQTARPRHAAACG